MKDKIYYYADFDLQALLSLAHQRRGRRCTCDVSQMPKAGSLNWVIFIAFDDGVEWVFRSLTNILSDFYSDETASKIIVSEASTLMYLKAHTSVPVPEVYSYSGSSDNDIGVPYILQSKAAGRCLGSYDWSQRSQRVPGYQIRHPPLPISDKDREKVMSQLGAIMSELSDHRFGKIGSVFKDESGTYFIGECLSPSLSWQERDSLELNRGPFHEERDYFNITCVIDWSSASSGPVTELLATPSLGSSSAPPSDSLAAAFRSGFSQRATTVAPEISHLNLWEISDRVWYFSRLVRLLSKNDYHHFRSLYELVYETSTERTRGLVEILWLFHKRVGSDENKNLLVELQDEDLSMEELQEKERARFPSDSTVNSDRIVVARKLTLMSEMNPGFLADYRLWQWVEECRRQDASP